MFQIFKSLKKETKNSNWINFWTLFFINEFHLKITLSYRFFTCKTFCILFPNWILLVIKKVVFIYLESDQRHTMNSIFSVFIIQTILFKSKTYILFCRYIFYHSKYLAFLRNQIYSFPKDELTNVPTWEKNSNNQHKLAMFSDRFPSWNLLFVNIECY